MQITSVWAGEGPVMPREDPEEQLKGNHGKAHLQRQGKCVMRNVSRRGWQSLGSAVGSLRLCAHGSMC